MAALFSRLFGTRSAVDWIEPDALRARLAGGDAPLVIDVRGPDEFSGPLGHIDGAVNTPLDRIGAEAPRLAGQSRPLVLVCHTDRRSSAAAAQLRAAGATGVAVLRGGMLAWRQGSAEG